MSCALVLSLNSGGCDSLKGAVKVSAALKEELGISASVNVQMGKKKTIEVEINNAPKGMGVESTPKVVAIVKRHFPDADKVKVTW